MEYSRDINLASILTENQTLYMWKGTSLTEVRYVEEFVDKNDGSTYLICAEKRNGFHVYQPHEVYASKFDAYVHMNDIDQDTIQDTMYGDPEPSSYSTMWEDDEAEEMGRL